jgi:protein-L-isoaspartate(D-aspartate) O-methyltransferase
VIAAGIRDARVIRVLCEVPRVLFVPADGVAEAYLDEPVPIPHGQVTTQPSLIARMIEALELTGTETVLEVGTGYGFQAALLARLSRAVWTIERWPDVAAAARANLARAGIVNVEVVTGDGTLGLIEQAPFDAIVVSAAFLRVPPPLAEQLALGGRLVQPVGPGGAENVGVFVKEPHGLVLRARIAQARFVKLYGEQGFTE